MDGVTSGGGLQMLESQAEEGADEQRTHLPPRPFVSFPNIFNENYDIAFEICVWVARFKREY